MPSYQGKGIGRELFIEAKENLKAKGFSSLWLWVLEDNPSRKFYAKLGGNPFHSTKVEIGGKVFNELAYGWDVI